MNEHFLSEKLTELYSSFSLKKMKIGDIRFISTETDEKPFIKGMNKIIVVGIYDKERNGVDICYIVRPITQ